MKDTIKVLCKLWILMYVAFGVSEVVLSYSKKFAAKKEPDYNEKGWDMQWLPILTFKNVKHIVKNFQTYMEES